MGGVCPERCKASAADGVRDVMAIANPGRARWRARARREGPSSKNWTESAVYHAVAMRSWRASGRGWSSASLSTGGRR